MQAVISPTAQGHFRAKHRQKLSAGAVRTKVRSPAAETQRTGGECRSAGPELILCLLGARTAAWDCERTLAPGNSERSAARASCSRCSQRPQSTTESRAAQELARQRIPEQTRARPRRRSAPGGPGSRSRNAHTGVRPSTSLCRTISRQSLRQGQSWRARKHGGSAPEPLAPASDDDSQSLRGLSLATACPGGSASLPVTCRLDGERAWYI